MNEILVKHHFVTYSGKLGSRVWEVPFQGAQFKVLEICLLQSAIVWPAHWPMHSSSGVT